MSIKKVFVFLNAMYVEWICQPRNMTDREVQNKLKIGHFDKRLRQAYDTREVHRISNSDDNDFQEGSNERNNHVALF